LDDDEVALEVPFSLLSAEALRGVIDDFVLREGTDYGAAEFTLQHKRDQVLTQLRNGSASVMYDPRTQTCTIVARE
jgi:uncharacterized protein YheU (UPF0270 family)